MYTRYLVLLAGILLVACSAATEPQPATQPEPTVQPEPSATPTELEATEIPPSPTPAPTETLPPTLTQVPTDTPAPIQFNFTWYENNPIIKKGSSNEWDYWRILEGKVVVVDDIFHMFYSSMSEGIMGIGYALSPDGLEFTKHDANPIIQSDGEGFDANGILIATPLVMDNTWMLFYGAIAPGGRYNSMSVGTSSVGLTTAPGPTGPWTAGQQVLTTGVNGEWDSGFIYPSSVIVTEDGYRMYYTAGIDPEEWGMTCGMATSPDGISWTKYDDPSTTEAPFADSDPVIQPGPSGWDRDGIDCTVINTDAGWEMFYEGWGDEDRIGYASSPDGVNWTKYKGNAMIGNDQYYPSAIKVGSTYYLYAQDETSDELSVVTGRIDKP